MTYQQAFYNILKELKVSSHKINIFHINPKFEVFILKDYTFNLINDYYVRLGFQVYVFYFLDYAFN